METFELLERIIGLLETIKSAISFFISILLILVGFILLNWSIYWLTRK